jgi:hypothetical protein
MKLKSLSIVTVLAVAALLALLFGLLSASHSAASDLAPMVRPESAVTTPTTIITVTSGTDPDDSQSKTCYTDPPGPAGPPTAPCTLRRAIIEANNLAAGARPILIKFNIPADAGQGYVAALGIWKLQLHSTTQTQALPRLADGQIIIDGTTQPGGRPSGPKIIIVGPGTGQKNGLLVGDVAGDNSNEIRGLGFQNFKDHLTINTDYNVIENNWFGLNDDGTAPHLRNGNPQDGSGSSGVAISAGADHNTIRLFRQAQHKPTSFSDWTGWPRPSAMRRIDSPATWSAQPPTAVCPASKPIRA